MSFVPLDWPKQLALDCPKQQPLVVKWLCSLSGECEKGITAWPLISCRDIRQVQLQDTATAKSFSARLTHVEGKR